MLCNWAMRYASFLIEGPLLDAWLSLPLPVTVVGPPWPPTALPPCASPPSPLWGVVSQQQAWLRLHTHPLPEPMSRTLASPIRPVCSPRDPPSPPLALPPAPPVFARHGQTMTPPPAKKTLPLTALPPTWLRLHHPVPVNATSHLARAATYARTSRPRIVVGPP